MLFYVKAAISITALILLGTFPVRGPFELYRATGFAIIAFLAALLVYLRLGKARLRSLIRFIAATFCLWTLSALILGSVWWRSEPYGWWVWWHGPFMAIRFSACILLAAYAIHSFEPREILQARLPNQLALFILLFRAFVLRLSDVLNHAILQLQALGFPHFGQLFMASFIPRARYPMNTHHQLSMIDRWRTTAGVLYHLLRYFVEQLVLVEIPEVGATLQDGQDTTRSISNG